MDEPTGDVISRARDSRGTSSDAIYRLVTRVIARRHTSGGTLLDVGCGQGALHTYVAPHVSDYIGADVIRYDELSAEARFVTIDLDSGRVPLPDACAEIVTAVETIEHLENPRAFFRELRRLTKPGGLILVTTPNQLSLLSKLTLLTKNQFNAFQVGPGMYPAHLTALLEEDLVRIAHETGLSKTEIIYSNHGRMPLSARSWPSSLGCRGRWFSDNLLMAATFSSGERDC